MVPYISNETKEHEKLYDVLIRTMRSILEWIEKEVRIILASELF